jgi:hypothetical protein
MFSETGDFSGKKTAIFFRVATIATIMAMITKCSDYSLTHSKRINRHNPSISAHEPDRGTEGFPFSTA